MELVSTINRAEPRFDERLQCDVHHVFYDFDARYGRLHMGEGSCCDMTGAIDLFLGIDPQCLFIDTFQHDGTLDTKYKLIRGEWKAFP